MSIPFQVIGFGDEEADACYTYTKSGVQKTAELESEITRFTESKHCTMVKWDEVDISPTETAYNAMYASESPRFRRKGE